MLSRRGFLKRLGIGAGVAISGVALAKEAEAMFGMGHEIDYEKALYVPGQKKLFDLHIEQATEQEVDALLAEQGQRVPRFHLTIAGRGTYLFDEGWHLIDGPELRDGKGRSGRTLSAAEVFGLERELFGQREVLAAKHLLKAEQRGDFRVKQVTHLPELGLKPDFQVTDVQHFRPTWDKDGRGVLSYDARDGERGIPLDREASEDWPRPQTQWLIGKSRKDNG